MAEIVKIFGAPGTGKTSTLIRLLNEELESSDVTLKDVVFVSFSNSAIDEVCERLNIRKGAKSAPFFRTLHGLALKELIRIEIYTSEQVRKLQKIGFVEGAQAEFCREMGIPFDKGDHVGASDLLGNRAFTAWSAVIGEFYPKHRDVERCLEELYALFPEYGEIIESWLRFKNELRFFDYNDILIEFYEFEPLIDAKIGFFDEVQDFNRLEFEILKEIISGLERVYLAGDDDQAIYSWKGAKPEFFLNLKGEERVLSKTYRLPSRIWEFAQEIITQVEVRKPKEIETRREGGVVKVFEPITLEEITKLAVALAKKYPNLTVFLLFRTNHMVYSAESILLEHAVPFRKLKGYSIWDKELVTAWNIIAKIRNGQNLSIDEWIFLVEHANPEIIPEGYREDLIKTLKNEGSIPIELMSAIRSVSPLVDLFKVRRKKTKELLKKAWQPIKFEEINLYVDTIHASKGKEADIVVLADAITSTIDSAIRNGFRDSELRVFYVGVTRARKAVFVAPLLGFKSFLEKEVVISAPSL